jgi:hypothetical protein
MNFSVAFGKGWFLLHAKAAVAVSAGENGFATISS